MLTVHQAWRKSHLFPHWVLDLLALALAPEETQMCQLVSQNKLPPNSVARNSKALSSCGFSWAGIWGRLCRFDVRSLRRDPRFGFSFPPVQRTPFRTQSKNLSRARLYHFLSHARDPTHHPGTFFILTHSSLSVVLVRCLKDGGMENT